MGAGEPRRTAQPGGRLVAHTLHTPIGEAPDVEHENLADQAVEAARIQGVKAGYRR